MTEAACADASPDAAGFLPTPAATTALLAAIALAVSACSTTPARRTPETTARGGSTSTPGPSIATTPPKRGGGYYLDDGPGDNPPADLDLLPDAVPRIERFASGANRPYDVFGVEYVPDLSGAPYRQRGVGSWYGRKFHGQRTSSGEIYDMFAMTAAHPTLPIPCYALVTNVQNGKSVIVRVNDRGPFLHNRIMDLSYAAALKLGYLSSGSGLIEVEMLQAADIAAGRIPITTNSVYVASVAGGGPRNALPVFRAPPLAAAAAPSAGALGAGAEGPPGPALAAATPAMSGPLAANGPTVSSLVEARIGAGPEASRSSPPPPATVAQDALPASYAARGIPADLIPDVQPPAQLPETASREGFYLQLGAFRARAGADSFAAHVTREIDPALASKVQVSDTNGFYRVRVGPYARRAEADVAATSLRGAIAQPVMVMPESLAR